MEPPPLPVIYSVTQPAYQQCEKLCFVAATFQHKSNLFHLAYYNIRAVAKKSQIEN
jgi:hypothetical protein